MAKSSQMVMRQPFYHGEGEFSRGYVSTNTVESYFALLKRRVMGSFHHVSKHQYIDVLMNSHSVGITGK